MILARKKRDRGTGRYLDERTEEEQARDRNERASAEDKELDAAVRRSIEVHGP
jgi:hypothetical protein